MNSLHIGMNSFHIGINSFHNGVNSFHIRVIIRVPTLKKWAANFERIVVTCFNTLAPGTLDSQIEKIGPERYLPTSSEELGPLGHSSLCLVNLDLPRDWDFMLSLICISINIAACLFVRSLFRPNSIKRSISKEGKSCAKHSLAKAL